MGDRPFRIVVVLLLAVICASQVIQAAEIMRQYLARQAFEARLSEREMAEGLARRSPEIKGVMHQIFVESQIASGYLKDLARR